MPRSKPKPKYVPIPEIDGPEDHGTPDGETGPKPGAGAFSDVVKTRKRQSRSAPGAEEDYKAHEPDRIAYTFTVADARGAYILRAAHFAYMMDSRLETDPEKAKELRERGEEFRTLSLQWQRYNERYGIHRPCAPRPAHTPVCPVCPTGPPGPKSFCPAPDCEKRESE